MSVSARLARAVNGVLRRRGRVLADRYHVRRLATPRETRNALAYVLLNVHKHLAQRGGSRARLGVEPDPASSGRWFDGWRGGTAAGRTRTDHPCVSTARSWLLRVGWRRHGLIDLRECPGQPHRRRRLHAGDR